MRVACLLSSQLALFALSLAQIGCIGVSRPNHPPSPCPSVERTLDEVLAAADEWGADGCGHDWRTIPNKTSRKRLEKIVACGDEVVSLIVSRWRTAPGFNHCLVLADMLMAIDSAKAWDAVSDFEARKPEGVGDFAYRVTVLHIDYERAARERRRVTNEKQ